jgi:site-specific DNA-methyltransferase (adenine-specific)
MKSKDTSVLETAKSIASASPTWADLSNALFNQVDGLVAKAYPTREDRERFVRSPEYKAIRELITAAQERTGLVEGAVPNKSGKFLVRVPRSLHAALDAEAQSEGVSLNQLVLTKLAVQLSQLASTGKSDLAKIAQAYLEVRQGCSIDRVVADPNLDRLFLHRCRELGVPGTDFELNWRLFTGRKNKEFSDLPKTKNYTAAKQDEFEFASEISLRHIQETERLKQHDVSLDKIVCDPILAAEFDTIAATLAPGFSPLDYRWVALGIRKAAGRLSMKAKQSKVPTFDYLGKTASIRGSVIPTDPGVYFFRCDDSSIFIGDTDNLRGRIERHFDSGGQTGIPKWLYDCGRRAMSLGIVAT